MSAAPYRIAGDDVLLALRVTPGARQPGPDGVIEGPEGRPYARLKVRAKAEDGAANADVVRTLAAALGRPRSALDIESGASARLKTVRISGGAAATIDRLKELFPT